MSLLIRLAKMNITSMESTTAIKRTDCSLLMPTDVMIPSTLKIKSTKMIWRMMAPKLVPVLLCSMV